MEDDHVDRPGVEAQQCVQLTGTNSSIGLIALINQRPSLPASARKVVRLFGSSRCAIREGQRSKTHFCFEKSHKPETAGERAGPGLWDKCLSFAGLVALAKWPDPIPSRTRPSNASAPMVLCLKTWESRSPPGLPKTSIPHHKTYQRSRRCSIQCRRDHARSKTTKKQTKKHTERKTP